MNRERKDRGKVDGPAPPRLSRPITRLTREQGDAIDRAIHSEPVKRYPSIGDGPLCPTGGEVHGRMYKLATKWYCPSQLHNGAPVTAKDGPREPTQHSFTDEEVLQSQQSH